MARRVGLDVRKLETNQGNVRSGEFLIVDDEIAEFAGDTARGHAFCGQKPFKLMSRDRLQLRRGYASSLLSGSAHTVPKPLFVVG